MPNIALVLSGAVSLGSWEAGVLDELLFQVDRLNRDRPPDDRFRIDVITGASAGAMTGALVARAVMLDLTERRLLRKAWVDDIDITQLIEGIPSNALLSKKPIEQIAGAYLAAPVALDPPSMAPPRLLMRFTVTNMSGVDFALPSRRRPDGQSDTFVSTFHAERRQFELNAANRGDAGIWDEIRGAAIASGNFPFAFVPQRLEALEALWPGHSMRAFPEEFTYIDGGLFNNEPLGEAVALAREIDTAAGHPGLDPARIFLLVDANLNRSKHDPAFTDASSLPETVLRTLSVVLAESSALDWLKARRFNNELAWRDTLLRVLSHLVETTTVDDSRGLLAALEGAADQIVDQKRALFPDRYGPDYRALAVERTIEHHAALTAGLHGTRRQIFGTLAFLLNSVAGLDKKSLLNLHVVYTTPEETAGDQIRSFAGFFNRDWRLHDYRVGRRSANQELKWILEAATGPYEREPGIEYDPTPLGEITMKDAPRRPRERFRDATVEKLVDLTRNLDIGPRGLRWAIGRVARWGLKKAVKSKLNEQLEL